LKLGLLLPPLAAGDLSGSSFFEDLPLIKGLILCFFEIDGGMTTFQES
jgi:hypothetical protein